MVTIYIVYCKIKKLCILSTDYICVFMALTVNADYVRKQR